MKKIEAIIGDEVFHICAEQVKGCIWFHLKGRLFVMDKNPKELRTLRQKKEKRNSILSPMPGKIMEIFIREGEKVEENQALLVLSAMKMEYTLRAPHVGVIKSLKVSKDELVSADQELLFIS